MSINNDCENGTHDTCIQSLQKKGHHIQNTKQDVWVTAFLNHHKSQDSQNLYNDKSIIRDAHVLWSITNFRKTGNLSYIVQLCSKFFPESTDSPDESYEELINDILPHVSSIGYDIKTLVTICCMNESWAKHMQRILKIQEKNICIVSFDLLTQLIQNKSTISAKQLKDELQQIFINLNKFV